MNKQPWLDAAEIFDAWRVVPRVLVFGYSAWAIYIVNRCLVWYQAIPAPERNIEASSLTTVVISAVTGLATLALKIYMQSGRDWSNKPEVQQ